MKRTNQNTKVTTANFGKISISTRFKDIMNDLKSFEKRALKDIPVELLAIDSTYQTPERTQSITRKNAINKLALNWDENKLEPITVVPHVEEGMFYVVNGYGRWQASQKQEKPYEYLTSMVLLGAGNDVIERRKFESDLFAYQDREVAKIKPVEKHGALFNLDIPEVVLLEKMKQKYDFNFTYEKGQREKGVLGSYSEMLSIAKNKGEGCLDFIFSICKNSAFNRKTNGYASYIIRTLRDMYGLYPDNRDEIKTYLSSYFRTIEPLMIKSESVVKYPMLDHRTACSLFIEDKLVENCLLPHQRTYIDGKVIKLA